MTKQQNHTDLQKNFRLSHSTHLYQSSILLWILLKVKNIMIHYQMPYSEICTQCDFCSFPFLLGYKLYWNVVSWKFLELTQVHGRLSVQQVFSYYDHHYNILPLFHCIKKKKLSSVSYTNSSSSKSTTDLFQLELLILYVNMEGCLQLMLRHQLVMLE